MQSFADTTNLTTLVLPPSLTTIGARAFNMYVYGSVGSLLPRLRTIIWKGRTKRPPIHNNFDRFSNDEGISPRAFTTQTLEALVANGTLQEIFVP